MSIYIDGSDFIGRMIKREDKETQTHVWHECRSQECSICEGGLGVCTVCGGAEGTLTTDCAGYKVGADQLDNVYDGRLDYRAGKGWVTPDGTGKSMGDHRIADLDHRYQRDQQDRANARVDWEHSE